MMSSYGSYRYAYASATVCILEGNGIFAGQMEPSHSI